MKKRIMGMLVMTVMVMMVLGLVGSCPILAGGGPLPEVLYFDVDTMEYINGEALVSEWEDGAAKEFVFGAPDGTSINAQVYNDVGFELRLWLAGMTQTGRYTLQSFYVPQGYEVVGVFCNQMMAEWEENSFAVTQDTLDAFFAHEDLGYFLTVKIYLRKIGSTTDVNFANPTSSTVLFNGVETVFDAYEINGNNYFKLRDLAFILSGTEKRFEVGWDEDANSISLTSGQPYTAVGGEMPEYPYGWFTTAKLTDSKILLDGTEVSFTAYNIEDNNYFKLRDIGAAINFGVDWDEAQNTIVIDTSKGYTPAE